MTTAGPKNAWLDGDGIRWYTFNERDYISVTSMRKMLGMPYNLHKWVIKQTLDVIQRDPTVLVPRPVSETVKGGPETPANVRGRITRLGEAERDKAAERGTEVHAAISNGQPLADLPVDLQPYVEQYAKAVIAEGIKPLLSEKQVFSKKWGYAGSFDLINTMRARPGKVFLTDLKTGNATYNDHAIQGMHYADADFVGEGNRIDEIATEILKSVTHLGILHLQPTSWEFHEIPITPALRQSARAMAVLAQFYIKFPTIQSLEV